MSEQDYWLNEDSRSYQRHVEQMQMDREYHDARMKLLHEMSMRTNTP